MFRNGIEVDQVTGFVELLRTTPAAGIASLRGEHRWRDGYQLDWHAEQVTLADQRLARRHTLRLDLRGAYQVADVRPGWSEAQIHLSVRTEAADEVLVELLRDAVRTSPVLDTVAHPVPMKPSVGRLT